MAVNMTTTLASNGSKNEAELIKIYKGCKYYLVYI